ncbi:hypothetical protein TIFTF001_009339 [Ficus carica]|uniref:Uncharacterized protein n=1 Tax=Ficus carica TaxID=3494 RepID=A0AA88A6L5_FICCA|nr:hypothetical protein TIFTF001_009339 [Ficus carica]
MNISSLCLLCHVEFEITSHASSIELWITPPLFAKRVNYWEIFCCVMALIGKKFTDSISHQEVEEATIWDDVGRILSACAKRIIGCFSPHLAKCLVVRGRVSCWQMRLVSKVGFWESDAINVVKVVRSPAPQAPEVPIIHDIRDVMIHTNSDDIC